MRKPRFVTGFGAGFGAGREAGRAVGRRTGAVAGRIAGLTGFEAGREDGFMETFTGSSENTEVESSSEAEIGFSAAVGMVRRIGVTLALTMPKSRRLTIFLAPFSFSAIKTL